MNNNLLISIIITSYNYARFLGKAIDSCLNQSYKNIEIWVIDGASTDGTIDLLKSYGDKINWISEPDKGETDAMNKGLKFIKGDIVNFLCADNYLTPNAFKLVSEAFTNNPKLGLVFSDLLVHDSSDNFLSNIRQDHLSFVAILNEKPPIAQSAGFINKKVFQKLGNFNENLKYVNDHEMWLRILKNYPGKYISHPLAVNIDHHNTITNRHKIAVLLEAYKINRKYGAKIISNANKFFLKAAIKHLLGIGKKI